MALSGAAAPIASSATSAGEKAQKAKEHRLCMVTRSEEKLFLSETHKEKVEAHWEKKRNEDQERLRQFCEGPKQANGKCHGTMSHLIVDETLPVMAPKAERKVRFVDEEENGKMEEPLLIFGWNKCV